MCKRGDVSLCDISVTAVWMCDLNFNILRHLNFMMEVWVNSA